MFHNSDTAAPRTFTKICIAGGVGGGTPGKPAKKLARCGA
jgi:hypothetical protein